MVIKVNDFEQKLPEGFNYTKHSAKYLSFKNQVAIDEQKVLIKVANSNLLGFVSKFNHRIAYIYKLDLTHCVYLKDFQVFEGYYGTYILLNKKYWNVKTVSKPFEDMVNKVDTSWQTQVVIAKKQEKYNLQHKATALVGRMNSSTIQGSKEYHEAFM